MVRAVTISFGRLSVLASVQENLEPEIYQTIPVVQPLCQVPCFVKLLWNYFPKLDTECPELPWLGTISRVMRRVWSCEKTGRVCE